ncbi:MAG: Gfo/Idh/MocA family oxidoreductase [Clostridiaceae bacterium]|nr:Gfo/Idh/MocA family oxidoreductase [Clostridiaceae bacterium]
MLRVCVIGLGPIGNTHATVYQSLPEVELAGVCDRQEDRARKAGERFGVAWYLDAQTMLDELKPDLVSVATGGFEYSSDHYEPTLQALHAGAHVLCEKPICNDLAKAEEMVRTAKELDRCFALDFNHRFTPAARTAKEWQREGRLGELLFLNMNLWIGRFGEFDTEFYHLKALNPHSVDFVRHFGGDIEEVQCFAMKAAGRDIYSTQSMNLRFACGAVGHITSSYDIRRGHPMERCEVAGTEGRLLVEDMWREATLYPADSWVKQVYTNPVFGGYGQFFDTFAERIATFVREVAAGVKPADIDGSGRDGLEASRVIHAAIESIKRGGQPVAVAEIIR